MTESLERVARGRLLDLHYEVHATDRALAAYLSTLFRDSAIDDPDDADAGETSAPTTRFELHGTPHELPFRLTVDGEEVTRTDQPVSALSSLVWHVNRRTVERSATRLLFHASVVDLGDRSIAFLGRSGAGKTTSALRSARRFGGSVVTDDIASIEADGTWSGAAKPVGLRDGSRTALGLDDGSIPMPPRAYRGETWYAAVSELAISVADRAILTDIVRLTTDSGNPSVTPIRRSVGFAGLLEAAFDHRAVTTHEVERVAGLVRHCRFWSWHPSHPDALDNVVTAPPGS